MDTTTEVLLETQETLLWRQIHPSFCQENEVSSKAFQPLDGVVSSAAFRPSKDHDYKLSTSHGDLISAEACWERHTQQLGRQSEGVLALNVSECQEQELPVIHDQHNFEDHVSIDFRGNSRKGMEKKASKLRYAAEQRGWQYIQDSE